MKDLAQSQEMKYTFELTKLLPSFTK